MLSKLQKLSAEERRDLWPAAWRLVVIRLALMVASIKRLEDRFGGQAKVTEPTLDTEALELWTRRALAFKRTGRFVPGARCLARSLALRWWMRARGIQAELSIGARRSQTRLDVHSWIHVNGVPIDELPEQARTFKPIRKPPDQGQP